MTTRIGRNDPCPCGSGKKHKKCCLQQAIASKTLTDLTYRKLRQLEGVLFDKHLMPYCDKELPKGFIKVAMDDFSWGELPEDIDNEAMFKQLFIPWMLFNWIPGDEIEADNFDSYQTIAQNYLAKYRQRLNKEQVNFINAMNETYFSFYSVLEVEKGKGMVVKDCLLNTPHNITENQATYQITRGEMVFGRLFNFNERTVFMGFTPYVIPANYQTQVIHFRQWLSKEIGGRCLTPAILRDELEYSIFDYYLEILDDLFNPKMPQLQNTDGDELQFTKSYFKLSISPEEALTKLLPLTLSDDAEEFLSDATRNETGQIKHLKFPWLMKGNKQNKSWENTVLGHIIIKNDRLILETNSANRDEKGKKLLSEYLQENIQYQRTLIESPGQKLKSLPKNIEEKPDTNPLLESPEVQMQIKEMAKAQWDVWFDTEIPALKNRTPREAAKTEEGRELLEALLLEYESRNLEGSNNALQPDITYLKKELGLS